MATKKPAVKINKTKAVGKAPVNTNQSDPIVEAPVDTKPGTVAQQEKPTERFPIFDVEICFRTSCNKNDAVAKMLGWIKGSLRYVNDYDCNHEYDQLDLIHINSLPRDLDEILLNLRYTALQQAFESSNDIERVEKFDAFGKSEDLINKAGLYLCSIDDELSKAELSQLRIDKDETDLRGETYITLVSLDVWAKKTFPNDNISILDTNSSIVNIQSLTDQQHKNDTSHSKGFSPTIAYNYRVTFALLLAFYNDNKPNYVVSEIANEIRDFGMKMNNDSELKGQSDEAIKQRIEESRRVLDSALPNALARK